LATTADVTGDALFVARAVPVAAFCATTEYVLGHLLWPGWLCEWHWCQLVISL